MFQRTSREFSNATAVVRQAPHPDHYVANAIGKTSLIPQVTPHFGAADARAHAIEGAHREIRALRGTLFPALIKALRSKAPALHKQLEVMTAASQLRHMLTVVNQRVVRLEQAETYADPMLRYLRAEISALTGRATRLGVYQGREHLVPRGYEDPIKLPQYSIHRKPGRSDHKHDFQKPSSLMVPAHVRRRAARGTPGPSLVKLPATPAVANR